METQTQEPSSSINKAGPKPKANQAELDALKEQVDGLTSLVLRMAHNSGTAHLLIKKAGLEPYNPSKADMSKYLKAGDIIRN